LLHISSFMLHMHHDKTACIIWWACSICVFSCSLIVIECAWFPECPWWKCGRTSENSRTRPAPSGCISSELPSLWHIRGWCNNWSAHQECWECCTYAVCIVLRVQCWLPTSVCHVLRHPAVSGTAATVLEANVKKYAFLVKKLQRGNAVGASYVWGRRGTTAKNELLNLRRRWSVIPDWPDIQPAAISV